MKFPTVAVLIDALGWELVRSYGFLSDLCPQQKPVRTILGYSSAAIPCLLTGDDPATTGMWSLFYRNPRSSPFGWTRTFSWLPEPIYENRYARWLVRRASRVLSGYSGYFYTYAIPLKVLQTLDISERKNIYRAGSFVNGCQTIFDRLETRRIPYRSYSYHDGADDSLVIKAKKNILAGQQRFYFLYLSGLDAALHRDIASPERVKARLRHYESLVRGLYTAAVETYGGVDFHVFSDHGMTPTLESFDLRSELRATGLAEGNDYLALFDSTMARFWFFSEAAREKIGEKLARIHCGKILTDGYLRDEGVFFEDRRYGELIFLMQPGTLIVPSHMGLRPVAGMHGFDPEDRHSTAMYMTNRTDRTVVRHLKDVVGTVLAGGEANG